MTHRMPNAARMVSTHASVRRRPLCLALVAAIMGFNSRLREEATGAFSPSVVAVASFNSRLREEATRPHFMARARAKVSTHASVRRRHSTKQSSATSSKVSTHASVRRRPEFAIVFDCVRLVSTHASVRRRRGCAQDPERRADVSTHASVRRRQSHEHKLDRPYGFQLTPP